MLFHVRPATSDDAATLANLLDASYRGGYLATFDRDGLPPPNDLWWVQSEKDVSVIEVDRAPVGVIVLGRGRGPWLVEEVLLPAFGEFEARSQDALIQRTRAHLTTLLQRGRQGSLILRAAETNAFGLALAHELQATFANALVVYRYHSAKRPPARLPDGFQIQRASAADARVAGRLTREVIAEHGRAEEIERVFGAKEGRGYLAMKDGLPVGFAVLEVRARRGDWFVGVRESHRRRGVGRALAATVLGALLARAMTPFATAWALDPVPGAFMRALGFQVERTYLYLEKPL